MVKVGRKRNKDTKRTREETEMKCQAASSPNGRQRINQVKKVLNHLHHSKLKGGGQPEVIQMGR